MGFYKNQHCQCCGVQAVVRGAPLQVFYVPPLFLPLPLLQQVGVSPQLADQAHLHLCQNPKEDKTRQESKISLSSHKVFEQAEQWNITVETSCEAMPGMLIFSRWASWVGLPPLWESKRLQHSSEAPSEVLVLQHPHLHLWKEHWLPLKSEYSKEKNSAGRAWMCTVQ